MKINGTSLKLESYQKRLRSELRRRQKRNPNYTTRAFARDLGVSTTSVFEVIQGVRHFSRRSAIIVGNRLKWTERQISEMLESITKSRIKVHTIRVRRRSVTFGHPSDFEKLSVWYVMAVYHLAALPHNNAAPDWIANHLAISPAQAKEALEILTGMSLVKIKKGQMHLTRSIPTYFINSKVQKVIKYQQDLLKKASHALQDEPYDRRMSLIKMFVADPKKLRHLESKIWDLYEHTKKISVRAQPTELYTLAVQVFPLTRSAK